MKQLILTFFLVILCYSLFFDKKTENSDVRAGIVGHTENDCNADATLNLSNLNPTSAITNLTGQFIIEASRIETDGKSQVEVLVPFIITEDKTETVVWSL